LDLFTFKLLATIGIIVFATIHGFGAAWMAIWMLFHPYKAVKVRGITIWPQGMIPRHREKLAESIGHAVGNELVSQQTVFDALFETSFFHTKVEDFVGVYTNDLLSKVYKTKSTVPMVGLLMLVKPSTESVTSRPIDQFRLFIVV